MISKDSKVREECRTLGDLPVQILLEYVRVHFARYYVDDSDTET